MKKSLLFLFLLLLLGAFFLFQHGEQDKYKEALELYQKGNASKDTLEKNELLNQSLEVLLSMHEESPSKNALTGELLAVLRQYPLAVYYYLQALELDPENKDVQEGLKRVIQESKLPAVIPPFPKLANAKLLFSSLFLAWIVFLSFALWNDWRRIQKAAYYLAIPLALFGVYLAGRIFFAPIYGVMIHSQELYQDAGKNQPQLGPIPLPSGVVVTVLDEEEEGEWLKIRTLDGVLGYVPEDAIRVLY